MGRAFTFGETPNFQPNAAAGVLLVHAALLWLLMAGLSQRFDTPTELDRETSPITLFHKPETVIELPLPQSAQERQTEERQQPSHRRAVEVESSPASETAPAAPLAPLPVATAPVSQSLSAGEGMTERGASAGQGLQGTGQDAGSGPGTGSGAGSGGRGTGGSDRITQPSRKLTGSLTSDDYPSSALRAKAQGTTRVRFTVEASGRVGACTVTTSSGHQDLDAKVCEVLRARYRYTPARDAGGNAVSEVRNDRFTWVLP